MPIHRQIANGRRIRSRACASIALAFAMACGSGHADAKDSIPTLQSIIGSPDDFTLGGSTRLRYEAIGGRPRAGFRASEDLVSLRTIVAGEYRHANIRLGAELYDSRAFGIDSGGVVGTGEVNTVELVQANATLLLPDLFGRGSKASIEAGRMTLNVGSRRLIAADDYRNTTNGYTGTRVDGRLANGVAATLLYVMPQMRLPEDAAALRRGKIQMDRENFDTQLWGAFLSKPALVGRAMGEVTYVGFAEKDAPGRATRDRRLSNVSARMMSDPKPGTMDFEVEGIYQFGSISASTAATAARLSVSAWFAHADAGFTFRGPLKAHLSVEYDYASGAGGGRGYGRFDTLYGMRRADFSPSGIYAAIGRANIIAPGIRLEVAPAPRLDAFAAWHPMWLADRRDSFSNSNIRDATGASGNFAGHNLDCRVRWWAVPKRLRTEVNGSYLAKGRFLSTAPNAGQSDNTRYIALSATAFF
jgi:hypothetical protein